MNIGELKRNFHNFTARYEFVRLQFFYRSAYSSYFKLVPKKGEGRLEGERDLNNSKKLSLINYFSCFCKWQFVIYNRCCELYTIQVFCIFLLFIFPFIISLF